MTCNYNPKPVCKDGIKTTSESTCCSGSPKQPQTPCTANLCQVSYTTTCVVTCKYCGSKNVVKYGKKGSVQYYHCNDCGRKFAGNDAIPGMRFPSEQIAAAISLFYDGLSIDAIRRQLQSQYNVYPSDSTVYEWIVRFTKVATKEAKITDIKVGDVWIADETFLKLDEGKDIWFWDIIDDKTRFLLASYMSLARTTLSAKILMDKAAERADKAPRIVITDKLAAYFDGIELAFGAYTKHIPSQGFSVEPNTNLIERFHGTLKARTKVMRGMKNKETARLIMDGWLVHYNFFRPHESLGNKTPGEIAKATFKYKSWKDVVIGSNPIGGTCGST
jgi:putative transposase